MDGEKKNEPQQLTSEHVSLSVRLTFHQVINFVWFTTTFAFSKS